MCAGRFLFLCCVYVFFKHSGFILQQWQIVLKSRQRQEAQGSQHGMWEEQLSIRRPQRRAGATGFDLCLRMWLSCGGEIFRLANSRLFFPWLQTVSFPGFFTSFFVVSAQDTGMASRRKHNKCLPAIFMVAVMLTVEDTVKKMSLNKSQIVSCYGNRC